MTTTPTLSLEDTIARNARTADRFDRLAYERSWTHSEEAAARLAPAGTTDWDAHLRSVGFDR